MFRNLRLLKKIIAEERETEREKKLKDFYIKNKKFFDGNFIFARIRYEDVIPREYIFYIATKDKYYMNEKYEEVENLIKHVFDKNRSKISKLITDEPEGEALSGFEYSIKKWKNFEKLENNALDLKNLLKEIEKEIKREITIKKIKAKNRNIIYSTELVSNIPKKYNNFRLIFNKDRGTIAWVRGDLIIAFTPFWDGNAGIPYEIMNKYTNKELMNGIVEFEKTDNIKIDAAEYLIKLDELFADFNKYPKVIAALTSDREAEFDNIMFEIKVQNDSGLDSLSKEIIDEINDRGIETSNRVEEVIKDQLNYILIHKMPDILSIKIDYKVMDDGAKMAIDLIDMVMTKEDRESK